MADMDDTKNENDGSVRGEEQLPNELYDEEQYFAALGFGSDDCENVYDEDADAIPNDDPQPSGLEYSNLMFRNLAAAEWFREARLGGGEPLFGPFWREGEVAIVFADTGKGKSLLAVQIAESIASGNAIAPLRPPANPQPVLYFDFELNERQFANRYSLPSDDGGREAEYPFHPHFRRIQMNAVEGVETSSRAEKEMFEEQFTAQVQETGARVVIIDNFTYISSGFDNNKQAASMMKSLKRFSRENDLSILVLAHTPKRRFSLALTENDLHGSKMIANFADSLFAIGHSRTDNAIRYLKQIKCRSSKMIYDEKNIILYRIGYTTSPQRTNSAPLNRSIESDQSNHESLDRSSANLAPPLLGFRHIGYAREIDHLYLTNQRPKPAARPKPKTTRLFVKTAIVETPEPKL